MMKLLLVQVGNKFRIQAVISKFFRDEFRGNRISRYRYFTGADKLYLPAFFVAKCLRDYKQDLHIILQQAPGKAITSRTQTSRNMRRKLPAKHQYLHTISVL